MVRVGWAVQRGCGVRIEVVVVVGSVRHVLVHVALLLLRCGCQVVELRLMLLLVQEVFVS